MKAAARGKPDGGEGLMAMENHQGHDTTERRATQVLNSKLIYNNDVGDLLIAVTDAMSSVEDALDELKGYGETDDVFVALNGVLEELEARKDKFEGYMSGEYQQQLAEMQHEYMREAL